MAQLLVRNLEEDVKARLRSRAARSGRSLEAEVRQILRNASHEGDVQSEAEDADQALSSEESETGLGSEIAALFQGHGFKEEDIEQIERLRRPWFEPAARWHLSSEAQASLEARAAAHERTLEAEITAILEEASTVAKPRSEELPRKDFATAVMELFRDNPLQPGEIQEIRGNWTRPAEFE